MPKSAALSNNAVKSAISCKFTEIQNSGSRPIENRLLLNTFKPIDTRDILYALVYLRQRLDIVRGTSIVFGNPALEHNL
jgi:hypothetical protein